MQRKLVTFVLLVGVSVLVGCAKKQQTAMAPTRAELVDPGKLKRGQLPAGLRQEGQSLRLSPLYFDYDSAVLRPESGDTLTQVAAYLRKNPQTSVIVEGHCDERGTEEYNLSLGQRRARVARDYLVRLGIAPSRIRAVSYGKLKPAVIGKGEQAWSKNRRGEFVPEQRRTVQ